MAVEALGRVAATELADLAVVGVTVRGQAVLVAAAALFGDQQLERVQRGAGDFVRGVAVDAGGGLAIVFFQQLFAVDGALVGLELVIVAATAELRHVFAPGLVFG